MGVSGRQLRKVAKPKRLTPKPFPRTVYGGGWDEGSTGGLRAKVTEERDGGVATKYPASQQGSTL